MFNFYEKDDANLQRDVLNELKWDPSICANQINVTAKNGIVTLRGNVPHYSEKYSAEKVVRRVGGVRAIADEIEVKLLGSYERSDADIAATALMALEWNYQVPAGVTVTVEKGWITLRGEVDWEYERILAKDTVSMLMGVTGVSNDITLKTVVDGADVKTQIEEALKRTAECEGRSIEVKVKDNKVTLCGTVHSLSEMEEARVAAWNAPGVTGVENNLQLVQ